MRFRVLFLLAAMSFLIFSTVGVTPASVNQPPVANAGPDLFGITLVAVTLDGSSSYDLDGTIVSYEWNFGDGSPIYAESTSSAPDGAFDGITTHVYPFGGYITTLTVMDDGGLTDTDTATVTITNRAPVADANGPYTGTVGVPVTLDGSGSWDPDDTIISWEWDLDNDGEFNDATGVTAPVTFWSTGIHFVGLRVTDGPGDTDIDVAIVEIPEAAGVPEFPLALPALISLAAVVYLTLRKRIGKNQNRNISPPLSVSLE